MGSDTTIVALRGSGDTGMRGITAPRWSLDWRGGVLFVVALLLAPVAIVLAARDVATLQLTDTCGSGAAWVAVVAGTAARWQRSCTCVRRGGLGSTRPNGSTRHRGGRCALVRNRVFSAMALTAAVFVVLLRLASPAWPG